MSGICTLDEFLTDNSYYQYLVDMTAKLYSRPWWMTSPFGVQRLNMEYTESLDWTQVVSVMQQVPNASIIDYSADKPERSLPSIFANKGEISTFGNKYVFSKRDQRRLRDLQNAIQRASNSQAETKAVLGLSMQSTNNSTSTADLIKFMVPYMERLVFGPHKTIDTLLLQGISEGKMVVDENSNPQGVKYELDWGIKTSTTSTSWSNTASATPIKDLFDKYKERKTKGIPTTSFKMSFATFEKMINTDEFKNRFGLQIQTGTGATIRNEQSPILTDEMVSTWFKGAGLPPIEKIEDTVEIEQKDGTFVTAQPFADDVVTFVANEQLGTLSYTYSEEEMTPDACKVYAKSYDVLVSQKHESGKRIFESEFNAFPVLNTVDHIEIFKTETA